MRPLLDDHLPIQGANLNRLDSIYRDSTKSHRNRSVLPEDLVPSSTPLKILLVDDDPIFGKMMQRAAQHSGIKLTCCTNSEDFNHLGHLNFEVGIVDYDLGSMTGIDITHHLERVSPIELPVILISQTTHNASNQWPDSMREFVHKTLGPFAILSAAIEAFEIQKIHRKMKYKLKI